MSFRGGRGEYQMNFNSPYGDWAAPPQNPRGWSIRPPRGNWRGNQNFRGGNANYRGGHQQNRGGNYYQNQQFRNQRGSWSKPVDSSKTPAQSYVMPQMSENPWLKLEEQYKRDFES